MNPLIAFVFVGLFSPGPNVILLTASGARFGLKRTVPHILGVAVGVGITAGLTGLGIGALVQSAPALTFVLKLIAAGWIAWMAFALWTSTASGPREATAEPWTLLQAALFQWINPKVWALAVAAASGFQSELPPISDAARLGMVFSTLNLGICFFWTIAGSFLSLLLTTPNAWRIFARTMAAGLLASAVMVFL
jgi:threonine/homoserine/homoserine lactone efflux protein